MALFADRRDAGRRLGDYIKVRAADYVGNPDVIVLALPRGGVPVGYEVARALAVPLDVYAVRKIGIPGHEELGMGAVAADGTCVVDETTRVPAGITHEQFDAALARELAELKRCEVFYRGSRPEPDLLGMRVILVDDGLATGASMYSAYEAVHRHQPAEIALAVPVAAAGRCRELQYRADRILCPYRFELFGAVGFYYADFEPVAYDEVRRLLDRAERDQGTCKAA